MSKKQKKQKQKAQQQQGESEGSGIRGGGESTGESDSSATSGSTSLAGFSTEQNVVADDTADSPATCTQDAALCTPSAHLSDDEDRHANSIHSGKQQEDVAEAVVVAEASLDGVSDTAQAKKNKKQKKKKKKGSSHSGSRTKSKSKSKSKVKASCHTATTAAVEENR
jgi:hypothetical protein